MGRALTWIGAAWMALIVLGIGGMLSEGGALGEVGDFIAGGFVPALVLLGAGRAIKNRAGAGKGGKGSGEVVLGTPPQAKKEKAKSAPTPPILPGQSPQPVQKPPEPKPVQKKPEPKPKERPVPSRTLEEVLAEQGLDLDEEPTESARQPTVPHEYEKTMPSSVEHPPKTSQEMIEEARRKWGAHRDEPD